MKINDRIKIRRKELGLSVDEVAKSLGINRATVYRYEGSDIDKISIDKLVPLAKALHTTPAYLMGWDSEEIIKPNIDIMSSEERDIISKFKKLDDEGQSFVKSILDREYQRCNPVKIEKIITKGNDSDNPTREDIKTDIKVIPSDEEF